MTILHHISRVRPIIKAHLGSMVAMKVRSLFLQIKYRCYEALVREREGTLFVEPYRSCSKWRGLNSLLTGSM